MLDARLLQLLIDPLRLAIGLRMVPLRETSCGSNQLTEGPPHTGGELGASVTDNVLGEAKNSKYMVKSKLRNLKCSRQLWKRYEMARLTKSVHNNQYNTITF